VEVSLFVNVFVFAWCTGLFLEKCMDSEAYAFIVVYIVLWVSIPAAPFILIPQEPFS
jgi:hypothetical protein